MAATVNVTEKNMAAEDEAAKMAVTQEKSGEIKESSMTVHMTKEALYDFLLFHAYSKFSGFLVNILGLAVAFMGIFSYTTGRVNGIGAALYLAAAVLFLGYTPFQLKMRAKKQVIVNREYNAPADYTFSDEGITIKQNGESKTYEWDHIERAVVTPKTIGIYYAGMCNDPSERRFRRPVCTYFYNYCNTAWTEQGTNEIVTNVLKNEMVVCLTI